jgi:hypothetical protein
MKMGNWDLVNHSRNGGRKVKEDDGGVSSNMTHVGTFVNSTMNPHPAQQF